MNLLGKLQVNPNGRIWGYVRASTRPQEQGPARQQAMIEELDDEVKKELSRIQQELGDRGEARQGKPMEVIVEAGKDACSAERVAYYDRPMFKMLMEKMRPGDTLVVWRLSRIDRKPLRALQAVEWMINHGINVVFLSELGGSMKVDLSSPTGVVFLLLMAMMLEMERNYRRLCAKEICAYRKAHGLAGGGCSPAFGRYKAIEYHPDYPGRYDRARKYWEWDEEECRTLARIIEWIRGGESFLSVSKRLKAEGVHRTGYERGKKIVIAWNWNVVADAYRWAEHHLETHDSLGPVPVPKAVVRCKRVDVRPVSRYMRAETLEVGKQYLFDRHDRPNRLEELRPVTIVKIYRPSVFWPKGAYKHVNRKNNAKVCGDPSRYYLCISGPSKEWTSWFFSSAASSAGQP